MMAPGAVWRMVAIRGHLMAELVRSIMRELGLVPCQLNRRGPALG